MPYSDNLYSMVDDDDSDLEEHHHPIDPHVLNQAHQYRHGGLVRSHAPVRQNLPHGALQDSDGGDEAQVVPGDGHNQELYDVDWNGDVNTSTAIDDDVFSPTDGYFSEARETGNTTTSLGTSHWQTPSYNPPPSLTAGHFAAASPNIRQQARESPHVPNIWVQDPSLQPGSTAESKAREADQERQANQRRRTLLNSANDIDATAAEANSTFHPAEAGSLAHTRNNSSSLHPTTISSQRASSSAAAGLGSGAGYSNQDAYSYSYYHPQSSSSSSVYNTSYTSYPRRQQSPYYSNFNSHYFPTPTEAPPAYTPSPTSPTSSASPSSAEAASNTSDPSSSNYRTFSDNTYRIMGGREETEGLLARDPESMGGPSDDEFHNHRDDQTTPVWRERMRRRLPYLNLRSGKVLLGGLVLLLVTIGFLTSLISGIENGRGGNLDGTLPPPPKSPSIKDPATDNPPGNPPMDKPPNNGDNGFQWKSGWNCQNNKIARPAEQFEVSFAADKALTIFQDIERDEQPRPPHLRHVQVQGGVIFRRSGEAGKPTSAIVLEVSVTDDRIQVVSAWDGERQTLVVSVPGNIPWDSQTIQGPCVNILATVWVPADGALSNLQVATTQLGISLYDDLSLSVSKGTRLSSAVGTITSAASGLSGARDDQIFDLGAPDTYVFRSPIIEAKTTSAPIKGSWPLLDYLGLISTSGNIKALIEPKEVDKEKPAPATLYIKSFSGNVEFRQPIHTALDAFTVSQAWKEAGREAELAVDLHPETVLPPRDYRVDVHTTSGNIRGAVAFSSTGGFKTTSGNMHLDLLPVLDSSNAAEAGTSSSRCSSSLSTGSTSGNTVVYILEPMWIDSVAGRYIPFPATGRAGTVSPPPLLPLPQPPTTEPGNDNGKGKGKERQRTDENGNPTAIIASAAQAALRCLNSQHTLTSGDMKLHYPGAWEGELSLATNSGLLTAVGDGVEVIKSGRGGPGGGGGGFGKYILARKGPLGDYAKSRLLAKTTSGDILLTVGS